MAPPNEQLPAAPQAAARPAAARAPKPRLLGELLIAEGLVTPEQLGMALAEQRRTKAQLGAVLVGLNFVEEATIAKFVAQQEGLPFRALSREPLDKELVALVPEALARQHKLVPIARSEAGLQLAMVNPNDIVALDAVRAAARLQIQRVVASASDIIACIDRSYRSTDTFEATFERAISAASWKGEIDAAQVSRGPIVELVDALITRAVEERATDIHLQPEEGILRVRLRIDGLLQAGPMIPKALQLAIAARLKVMAQLNLSESRLPQDGRIRFQLKTRALDLRISTFLTNFGENIVLRVLDRTAMALSLEKLGMMPGDLERFASVIRKPHGIVLVTGPTGSGKTSTLYSALSALNSIERNIMTIEEPIEYELPLVRQSQVNQKAGITFATGLRAILRQDPDIILIGEMRDEETSEMAVRAALTGHLVFSTLHTNTSYGAMLRLVDMGITPALLASSVNAVMAQRLCRGICAQCKTAADIPEARRAELERAAERLGLTSVRVHKGAGCGACKGTGFRGRIGLFELLEIRAGVREMVLAGRYGHELMREHVGEGRTTIYQDGLRKVLRGQTSLEEVDRVIEPDLRDFDAPLEARHGHVRV